MSLYVNLGLKNIFQKLTERKKNNSHIWQQSFIDEKKVSDFRVAFQ